VNRNSSWGSTRRSYVVRSRQW